MPMAAGTVVADLRGGDFLFTRRRRRRPPAPPLEEGGFEQHRDLAAEGRW